MYQDLTKAKLRTRKVIILLSKGIKCLANKYSSTLDKKGVMVMWLVIRRRRTATYTLQHNGVTLSTLHQVQMVPLLAHVWNITAIIIIIIIIISHTATQTGRVAIYTPKGIRRVSSPVRKKKRKKRKNNN